MSKYPGPGSLLYGPKRFQKPVGIPLQLLPGYDPVIDPLNKLLVVIFAAGHKQGVSGRGDARRGRGRVFPAAAQNVSADDPVGHEKPLEAEFAAQQVLAELPALRSVDAVYEVVGGHYREGL